MSQSETLQDIYSKIADIYQKFCDTPTGSDDDETYLKTNLSLSNQAYTATQIAFDNPNNSLTISKAQTQINNLIVSTLQIAKDNRLPTDETYTASTGQLVPIPKGSPIALLPELLKALLLYKAPLKVIMNVIIDIIQDVLRDHIKRKPTEKKAEIYSTVAIAKTQIIKIPSDAERMVFSFTGLPAWIGKKFEPLDLNKGIIQPAPSPLPDLSKFNLEALGSINFGLALTGTGVSAYVYWGQDVRLDYARMMIPIPKPDNFGNYQRYGYLYLSYENTATIGFLRAV